MTKKDKIEILYIEFMKLIPKIVIKRALKKVGLW